MQMHPKDDTKGPSRPFVGEKNLISVIVRTKDRPDLLKCALQSLAEQTLKTIEVIVINDGGQCIADLIDVFSPSLTIRYQSFAKPQGRAIAANAGIYLAKGQWTAFLDDDDIYLPAGLQILAEAATDDKAVYYGRVLCYLYTEQADRRLFRTFGQPFQFELLAYENFIPIIGCLIPTSQLLSVGGIDENFDCFEDWDLFYRLAQTLKFSFVDDDVAEYRVTPKSFITTFRDDSKQLEGHVQFYRKHWITISPDLLGRMHQAVKTSHIPFEVSREVEPIVRERNDIEAAMERAQDESEKRRVYIERLERESEQRNDYIERLERESEQRNDYIERLERESEQRNDYIERLERESERRNEYIGRVEAECEQRNDYIERLERESERRNEYIGRVEAESEHRKQYIKRLEADVDKRHEQFKRIAAEKENLAQTLVRYENIVSEEIDAVLVSVIIVNFNGKHHLERCLPSLLQTETVRFEMIVIDNGSADGSADWIREHYPEVVLLAEERNHGFGRANWLAAWHARGQYIALLNSDTVVEAGWLWYLSRALLLHHDIVAACSTLRLLDHPEVLNARGGGMTRLGFGFDIDFGQPATEAVEGSSDRLTDVLFPSGAAMLMRRQEFLEEFRFDPSFFMYHEDVDLGWRIWLRGRRVVVSQRSVVYHQFGGTTTTEKGAAWRALMGSRHNLRSLLKHYERGTLMPALADLVGLWLRQRAYRTMFDAFFWNLLHIRGTIKSRREIQRNRRRPDRELIDRGLIFQQSYPPAAPEIPVEQDVSDEKSDLVSPILFPGFSSATGRLGYGWYPPELSDGKWMRATSGRAKCRLSLEKGKHGRLLLEVMVPEKVASELSFTVTTNGTSNAVAIKGGPWCEVEIPAGTGDQGRIDLLLESDTWQPHRVFGNSDFRHLGLLVGSIQFKDDDSAESHPSFSPTVLITTFNRRRVLEETLLALENQTVRGFEVVVVDDGSSDDTWEMLTAWASKKNPIYNLRIRRQENTGQGVARNNGLQLATGNVIVFLGDDIFPQADWLAEHLSVQKSAIGPCAVVGYTDWHRTGMKVTPLMEMVNTEGQQFGYGFMLDGEDVPYTCFYTSNLSVPKQVLGLYPFDSSFRTYGWEDLELGYRLTRRGLRIIYNQKARAEHLHQYSLRSFFQRQRRVGESVHKLLAMHPQLASCRFMPDFRLPVWFSFGRFLFLPFIPILSMIDRMGVRLPRPLLRRILLLGFLIGEQDGRATQGSSIK